MGLGGSAHCLSMCGGVHSLLATPDRKPDGGGVIASDATAAMPGGLVGRTGITTISLFSLGRISSYTLAGLLFGSLAYSAHTLAPDLLALARLLSGLLLVLIGLQMLGWKHLSALATIGSYFWRLLKPLAGDIFPLRQPHHAYLAGAVWGWIPCGMVYSVLAWAILQGDPALAALYMFSFGLGTLPSMLLAGVSLHTVTHSFTMRYARNLAAAAILVFAGWTLYSSATLLLAGPGEGAGGMWHDHSHHHRHH